MTNSSKQYESVEQVFDIAFDLVQSVSPSQGDDLKNRLPPDIRNAVDQLQAKTITKAEFAEKSGLRFTIELFKAARFGVSDFALDLDKSDALETAIALIECSQLVDACNGQADKLTPLERTKLKHLNERFISKPYRDKSISVLYEYTPSALPAFITSEFFTQLVQEKLIATLDQNPNADLTPYEKEFGITIKTITHPDRSSIDTLPISASKKKVIL